MLKPKISVIIPIYNVEDYLEEALDSIVNQTLINDIEVLMIDDGSTDKSKYIVEKYALDYNNFYAYHKENQGLCSTRNYGLTIAKGEYIHFMDADDIILPNTYEKLYDFAQKNKCEIVTSDFIRFDNKKTSNDKINLYVFEKLPGNVENTNLYDYNQLSWDMSPCNKLIKREFLEDNNVQFSKNEIIYEDNLFTIEMYSKAKNVGILNEITYCWRIRNEDTSITQKYYIEKGKQYYEMAYLVNKFITGNITNKQILEKKYVKLLTIDLYYFIKLIYYHPNEYQDCLFESVYDILNLVPEKYIKKIHSYFQIIYGMVRQKEWNDLRLLLSFNFRENPFCDEDLIKKYEYKILCPNNNYSYEFLYSYANNINIENNCIVIDSLSYVPLNPLNNYEKLYFKIMNEKYGETLLNPEYIKDTIIYIPLELIHNGKTTIQTSYQFDNIEKESIMKTEINKIFNFENYDLHIKTKHSGYLEIIKKEKNKNNIIINEVKLDSDRLKLRGCSNNKLETITLNDFFDFITIEYPINYTNKTENNEFTIEIPYYDFLKSPIKKWIISSDEIFNKINLTKEYEFLNERYRIILKNYNNYIYIEFVKQNPLEELKKTDYYLNKLIEENIRLNKLKTDILYKQKLNYEYSLNNQNSLSETFFYDKGTLNNKNNNWYDIQNNVTETVTETGTLLTNNNDSTALIFANKINSEKRWANTFNWNSPFIIEVDILEYSNEVSFRISDMESGELSVPFNDLGITKNNHIKIINDGKSIEFYRDGISLITQTIHKPFLKCQIGFRIVKGNLKFRNFKIY